MKILTIIGTRPQYIKLKPLYDYFKSNNINNIIIDTNQHYSPEVSLFIIKQLDININYNINAENVDPISFISDCMNKLNQIVIKEKPDIILVFGDTNTTVAASLVSVKNNIKLAHIEAGIRCGSRVRPEEINRIITDDLSDIHFISRQKDKKNVCNPVYVGDLEYYYLNWLENSTYSFNIKYVQSYENFLLLTIHREENSNVKRLLKIFDFCATINVPIVFPIHHRIDKIIKENNIILPNNINICSPLNYFEMINKLFRCKGIISDSGGLTKICPYFGKKCIIPLDYIEWIEVIKKGYGTNSLNKHWFDNYKIKRNRKLYYYNNSCKIIKDKLYEVFES